MSGPDPAFVADATEPVSRLGPDGLQSGVGRGVGGLHELANGKQSTQAVAQGQAPSPETGTGTDNAQVRQARCDAKPTFDAQTARELRLGIIASAALGSSAICRSLPAATTGEAM